MTAPKIYVPAPGRPPEWVVDLMVEGRVNFMESNGLWWVYTRRMNDVHIGWYTANGQAIRLNEDGSLEIIDAPKEEPEQSGIEVSLEAWERILRNTPPISAYLVNFDVAADVMRDALAEIKRLRTEPEPTFTKSEVVEALKTEARDWRDSQTVGHYVERAMKEVAKRLGVSIW